MVAAGIDRSGRGFVPTSNPIGDIVDLARTAFDHWLALLSKDDALSSAFRFFTTDSSTTES